MTRTITSALAMFTTLALATAAAAQDAPAPAKELDGVKPMLKAWSCQGTNPAGETGAAKLTFKKELDGFWLSMKLEIKKTKSVPAFTGYGMWGVDPVKKDWVLEGWDNFGGTLHGRGADGMTWTGTSVDGGKEAPLKASFAIDAKTKHLHFTAEIGGQKAFDYDCK